MRLQPSKESGRNVPIISLDKCLAKTIDGRPGCTVLEHCFYVGAIAAALWERLSPEMQKLLPKQIVVVLAALHDIGKISPGFAKKIFKAVAEKFPDEIKPEWKELIKSSANWEEYHAKIGQCALKDTDAADWARAVGMHHGEIDASLEFTKSANAEIFGGSNWQILRKEAYTKLLNFFGSFPKDASKPSREQLEMAAALIVVADWLGSDEHFLDDGKVPKKSELADRANEILDQIGWSVPKPLQNRSFDEIFTEKAGKPWMPNEMQSAFYKVAKEPGVYVIEAPMGQGKTEAALWGAYRLIQSGYHNGIYFALPTRTTSDKIHERFELYLDHSFESSPGARLIHGKAWMKYFDKARNQSGIKNESEVIGGKDYFTGTAWFRPAKRALLQSFGVGTIDQTLLGVLPVKYAFLRLFGLAGKVIIFDEVHSYDFYTGTLLDKTIRELVKLGASVIILSATLTRSRRESLFKTAGDDSPSAEQLDTTEPYPLISYRYHSHGTGQIAVAPPPDKNIRLEHVEWDLPRAAKRVVEAAERGEMVLCVMNTVDKAQKLYRLVKSQSCAKISEERIGLLHSRFPAWQREKIEEKWLTLFGKKGNRSSGAILISTQVVEQSVDIDADLLITELAPTDMLLQRIGRLWRHTQNVRRTAEPRVVILYPTTGDEPFETRLGVNAFVYAPYILWRSAKVWRPRNSVLIPTDIRTLLETTYLPQNETGEALEMVNNMTEKMDKMKGLAEGMTSGGLPIVPDRNELLPVIMTQRRYRY